jgi:hypothetical protein
MFDGVAISPKGLLTKAAQLKQGHDALLTAIRGYWIMQHSDYPSLS